MSFADRVACPAVICFGAVAYGYDTGALLLPLLVPLMPMLTLSPLPFPFVTSPILFGAPHTHAGFFGGTIALGSFKAAYGLNADNSSNTSANLVSLFQAGSFFGAGLQLPMTTRLGRKWSIVISNLIFIVSAIVQTFANGS